MATSGTITTNPAGQATSVVDFRVELPAGGPIHLQTADEVDLWERSFNRYTEDYVIKKHNDLVTLGTLLQTQITIFRCQTAINGMEPELDHRNVPTGNYRRVDMDGADLAAYHKTLMGASKEMRDLEKQLGIDKSTRESGSQHTVDNYLRTVKQAAHERGIHLSKRLTTYDRIFNEAKWKLRLLYKADVEDRAYHNITPKSVLDWLKDEMEKLEQMDKDFARDKGKVFVGKL